MSRGYFADMSDLKKHGGKVIFSCQCSLLGFHFPYLCSILMLLFFFSFFLGWFIVQKCKMGLNLFVVCGLCCYLGRLQRQIRFLYRPPQQWSFPHWNLVILMVKLSSCQLDWMGMRVMLASWICPKLHYFVYRFGPVLRFGAPYIGSFVHIVLVLCVVVIAAFRSCNAYGSLSNKWKLLV